MIKTLVFGDRAQIDEAEDVARELREAVDAGATMLTLDLGALTKVDVTFFQILLAAGISLRNQGRSLSIAPLPADHIVTRTAALLGIDIVHHFAPDKAPK